MLYSHVPSVESYSFFTVAWKQLLLVGVEHVNAFNRVEEDMTFQIIVIFPFLSSCASQSGLYI